MSMSDYSRRGPPMLVGEPFPDSPKAIIYLQIREVLVTGQKGARETAEALSGLMALLDPWKDEKFYEDMRAITPNSDVVWDSLRACIRLLTRKNLWATAPRTIEAGKEFAQAI